MPRQIERRGEPIDEIAIVARVAYEQFGHLLRTRKLAQRVINGTAELEEIRHQDLVVVN